jgi:hypothetical protein
VIPVLVSSNIFCARVMSSSAAMGKEVGLSGRTAGEGAVELVAVVSDTCII